MNKKGELSTEELVWIVLAVVGLIFIIGMVMKVVGLLK